MIEHSASFDAAVVSDSRKQFVRAVFDLIDPDMVMEGVSSNDESPYANLEDITKRGKREDHLAVESLESNRWLLNGQFALMPDDKADRKGHVGWENQTLCDESEVFPQPNPYVEVRISGTQYLQAVTLEFSAESFDGVPSGFSVSVYSGGTLVDTKEVTDNTETRVVVDGFDVYYPSAVRLTIHKWSLPRRRVRVLRTLIGLYEEWDTRIVKSADIYTEATFSGLAIPYSTCTLEVYNENYRFDPYSPNSIFQSIEDRQAIKVELGLRLGDNTVEWIPGGTYYQQSGGWALKSQTIQWTLLDIIGSLVKRRFVVPEVLPTSLSGWMQAIMASLGVNFVSRYIVEDDVKSIPLTATKEAVAGKMCGELLRFACMATNTWPKQDFSTGMLRVGKLTRLEGNRITLDNMYDYPQMESNDDIADITFTLDEGEVVFPGNNTNSERSLSISNPFVHTEADARIAVISALFEYGGKYFQVNHRGNPSSEVGDIQAVDTQFLTTISARLYKQQLKYENGIMRNVPSYLVQSPNDSMYQNKIILTGSGTWPGLSESATVRLTLISGGTGGMGGAAGVLKDPEWSYGEEDLEGGLGGAGGHVFIVEFTVNAGQPYEYACGAGGAPGAGGRADYAEKGQPGSPGTQTTFGVFTSENGRAYENGIMDIQSGAVYAQKGADNGGKVDGQYGTGGAGGVKGEDGVIARYQLPGDIGYRTYVAKRPTSGTDGQWGKSGCVILEW